MRQWYLHSRQSPPSPPDKKARGMGGGSSRCHSLECLLVWHGLRWHIKFDGCLVKTDQPVRLWKSSHMKTHVSQWGGGASKQEEQVCISKRCTEASTPVGKKKTKRKTYPAHLVPPPVFGALGNCLCGLRHGLSLVFSKKAWESSGIKKKQESGQQVESQCEK